MALAMDARTWAAQQFSDCDFKDQRRTRKLIEMAANALSRPAASLPEQSADAADLKAAYRLLACQDVTFQAITAPHYRQSLQQATGRCLIINDTTELDFGIRRRIPGMATTGNGGGSGFHLHSALVVDADGEQIYGLAAQQIHYRRARPKKENTTQRLKRQRESQIWGRVIDQVGTPIAGAQWIHVMDRGADNFEVYCHCLQQQTDWIVRVSQKSRKILAPDGRCLQLKKYLAELSCVGGYEMQLPALPARAAKGRQPKRLAQPARTAKLEVRVGKLQMPFPVHRSPYLKRLSPSPIEMSVVHAIEVNPPKGAEPIEWILVTSLPVNGFDDAYRVLGYYEKRWLIEEWHKALKTGCRVEQRQLKSRQGLERLTGLLSVIALRLLQLKSLARTDPDRPAHTVIPRDWIKMLVAARKRLKPSAAATMTVGEFYRELAKLGGFIGRKSDGQPGWLTIWRGWTQLHQLLRGAKLFHQ